MKSKFLVCLDYGQGGIWRYVLSESKEQILLLYPELTIVSVKPKWMKQDILNSLENDIIDISDSENLLFKAILAEREERE